MRCPLLKELPPPPLGKEGWPWTEESHYLPDTTPDGHPWPKISIVTPSYNQAKFLEETIRSILLQGYPNLEYLVIDGASGDESPPIIQKYERWLTYWVSEKDQGQTQAINKGINRCNGEIFNWINSDDQLQPNTLFEVAKKWREETPHLVAGEALTIDPPSNRVLHHWQPKRISEPLTFIKKSQLGAGLAQPSIFLSLSLVKSLGGVREDLHHAFDWALYLRIIMLFRSRLRMSIIPQVLSHAYSHPDAKAEKQWGKFIQEGKKVLTEIEDQMPFFEKWRIRWILLREELKTKSFLIRGMRAIKNLFIKTRNDS